MRSAQRVPLLGARAAAAMAGFVEPGREAGGVLVQVGRGSARARPRPSPAAVATRPRSTPPPPRRPPHTSAEALAARPAAEGNGRAQTLREGAAAASPVNFG